LEQPKPAQQDSDHTEEQGQAFHGDVWINFALQEFCGMTTSFWLKLTFNRRGKDISGLLHIAHAIGLSC
jgi:hypothetical protein